MGKIEFDIKSKLDWFDELSIILSDIKYKDWGFKFARIEVPNYLGHAILQVLIPTEDGMLKGRKWYISSYMSKSEFIQTCFMAVLAAEEHEAREAFKYKGVAVLGPHQDLEQKVGFDVRAYQEQRNRDMQNIANDPKFFSPP